MKLTPAGVDRLTEYKKSVEALKKEIEQAGSNKNGSFEGNKLAIEQCGAAIRIAEDLLNQLPRTKYNFLKNTALAAKLAMNVLDGSYSNNYTILNRDRGSWAVGISNPHNAQLARLTKELTEDLQKNLAAYFELQRDQNTGALQLGIPTTSSTPPEAILNSALKQMETGITFWDSYSSLSDQLVRIQLSLMLNILNPHLLEDIIHEFNGRGDLVFYVSSKINISILDANSEKGKNLGALIERMGKAVLAQNAEEKIKIEAELKSLLISELNSYRPKYSIESPKLHTLYNLTLSIVRSQDSAEKASLEQQFGRALGNFNAYYIRQGCIAPDDHLSPCLHELKRIGDLECQGTANDAPSITLFCNDFTGKIGSLLAYNANIYTGFTNPSAQQTLSLNQKFEQLINRLADKILDYEKQSKNKEKIQYLENLLADLRKTQQVCHSDQKQLIANVLSIVSYYNHAHNTYVEQQNITPARAGEIFQDTLMEALQLFETHTFSCDTTTQQMLSKEGEKIRAKRAPSESTAGPGHSEAVANNGGSSSSPSESVAGNSSGFFPTVQSQQGEKEAEKEAATSRRSPGNSQ